MEGSIAQDAAHENLILKHRSKGSDYNYKHTPCHIRHGTLLPRYRPPCLGGEIQPAPGENKEKSVIVWTDRCLHVLVEESTPVEIVQDVKRWVVERGDQVNCLVCRRRVPLVAARKRQLHTRIEERQRSASTSVALHKGLGTLLTSSMALERRRGCTGQTQPPCKQVCKRRSCQKRGPPRSVCTHA